MDKYAPPAKTGSELIPVEEEGKAKRALSEFPGRRDGGNHRSLDVVQATHLIAWARERGLNAWLGHVIYMYGEPYVTERGHLYAAHKTGEFRGYSSITLQHTAVALLGYLLEDWVVEVSVYRKDFDHPFVALGLVTAVELEVKRADIKLNILQDNVGKPLTEDQFSTELARRISSMPIFRDPRGMAEKRGLCKAISRAFALDFESSEEV